VARSVDAFREIRLVRIRLEAEAAQSAQHRVRCQESMDARMVDFGRVVSGAMALLHAASSALPSSA
jgi:hypothetical protein